MNVPMEIAAYLAGVIDSDGYICVQRSTYFVRTRGDINPSFQARMGLKQVETQAIDLLRETFGGRRFPQQPSTPKGRPLWVWSVHSAACGKVLEVLLPHLRIKRQQAINALEVCRLVKSGRRFAVPLIIPGEPMVTAYEAAARLPYTYESVCQAVRKGSVPAVREGRRILIPESFLTTWAIRGTTPARLPEVSAQLEACFLRAKELNRVGVR